MEIKLENLLGETTLNKLRETLGNDELLEKVKGLTLDTGEAKLIPLEKFNETSEQVKALNERIQEQQKQVDELSKFKGSNEELQAKISELKAANEEQEKAFNEKLLNYKSDTAWDKALTKANSKNAKALKALIDPEKVKFNAETGELEGFDEQLELVKKDNGFLFNEAPIAKSSGFNGKEDKEPAYKEVNEEAFDKFRNI